MHSHGNLFQEHCTVLSHLEKQFIRYMKVKENSHSPLGKTTPNWPGTLGSRVIRRAVAVDSEPFAVNP